MTTAEQQYRTIVDKVMQSKIIQYPSKGECKVGVHASIYLHPDELPLIQGRKMYPQGIVGELKAFIKNAASVEEFEECGCGFWGAWANDDGSLDVDYARLLHNFNGVNQLQRVIKQLKETPDSRKIVLSLWDPSSKAKQVPCVLSYQWLVLDGELSMFWTQRSADIMVGLASDMLSAWLFNTLLAREVGLKPSTVVMNLHHCHIYKEHYNGAEEYLQLTKNKIFDPIKYELNGKLLDDFSLKIISYPYQKSIKFDLKI